MPDPVRAWARAVDVAYPDDRLGQRAVERAYLDALHARGLPTCMNAGLTRKDGRR